MLPVLEVAAWEITMAARALYCSPLLLRSVYARDGRKEEEIGDVLSHRQCVWWCL